MAVDVVELRISERRVLHVGDVVKVKPPHGGSFTGKIVRLTTEPDEVHLYGGSHGRSAFRAVTPDRVTIKRHK